MEGAIILSVSQGLTASAQAQQSSTDAAIADNQSSPNGADDEVDRITNAGPGYDSHTGNGGTYEGHKDSDRIKDGHGGESSSVDKDQTERDHGLVCTDNVYAYFDSVNDNSVNETLISADCTDNVCVRDNIENNDDDVEEGEEEQGEEVFNSPLRLEEEEVEADAKIKNEEEGISC